MSEVLSKEAVAVISDRIGSLQASARRTLPMFLIGVLATLIAAAVSLYYIISLSSSLRTAHTELHTTQAKLASAQRTLAMVGASLRELQRSAPTKSQESADATRIATALSAVSRSQYDLTVASVAIRKATETLPAAPQSSSPSAYFAVIGSYTPDDAGIAKAMQLQRAAEAAGFCVELWRTKLSPNYALVMNTRSDLNSAKGAIDDARKAGLATDAYVLPDSGWTKLPRSSNC